MIRLHKSKKGFTLVEMVLVIAIIVILAVVVFFSVASYIGKAQSATSSIKEHNDAINTVTAEIDSVLS
ncbi:MAG: type II secretion system protein [Clostridiales bacterium]|nr:type II secretion system protein [Clostridiales bacterium]